MSTLPQAVSVIQPKENHKGKLIAWPAGYRQSQRNRLAPLHTVWAFKMFQLVAATNKNSLPVALGNQQTGSKHATELRHLVKDKGRLRFFFSPRESIIAGRDWASLSPVFMFWLR